MKKLVLAVSVWWANVLALLPTSKTRKHVAFLKTELEITKKNVDYWKALYETWYAEHQKLQKQLEEKKSILTNAITRIDRLLEENTALVSQANTANGHGLRLESQVAKLTASVLELERQREVWVQRTEAHRDARREISSVLAKLGKKDPMQFPKPKPEEIQPQAISYRTPTVKDLKNGPIWVEVSENRVDWSPYYLIGIDANGSFKCKYIGGVSNLPSSFQFARIRDQTISDSDADAMANAELHKLGQIDSYAEKEPPPRATQPEGISYRTPTVEDLKNGPIAVEVSIDGSKWEPRTLQRITRGGRFICECEDSLNTNCFLLARIPDHQPTQNDATPNQTH
jgi:hypothetical protein